MLLVESEGPDPSYLLFLGLGFFTYNIDCHLFYLQKCTGLCVSGGVSRTGIDCVRITSTLAKEADTWAPCRCPEPEAAGSHTCPLLTCYFIDSYRKYVLEKH